MKRTITVLMTLALIGSMAFVGFAGTAAAGANHHDDSGDDLDAVASVSQSQGVSQANVINQNASQFADQDATGLDLDFNLDDGDDNGDDNGDSNGGGVLICHATSSSENPYVTLSVSEQGAENHLNNHPDDYEGPCDGGSTAETTSNSNGDSSSDDGNGESGTTGNQTINQIVDQDADASNANAQNADASASAGDILSVLFG